VPDRQALCGSLFVLHTGLQREYLLQEPGFGSGMTCWRRLAAWNEAGVREELHQLLNKLRSKNQPDWSRAVIDSPPGFAGGTPTHVRTARRGPEADPARSTAHGRAASTTSSPRRQRKRVGHAPGPTGNGPLGVTDRRRRMKDLQLHGFSLVKQTETRDHPYGPKRSPTRRTPYCAASFAGGRSPC
jgi:hypothetical protein